MANLLCAHTHTQRAHTHSDIHTHTHTVTCTHTHTHTQVQLFEALLVLADMQRSVLDAETALTTLSTTLTSLPVSLLSTSDCVDAFTAVWAKTKEFVSSEMREASSPVMVTSPELLGWTIVERVKKLPDSVKILYLEGELKAGKTW